METLDVIAGLAWDPEIRGFLSVLTGVVVLMGSVWLLLATNSGTRLATLVALAGFFGWMVIMGAVWWIYGIGWVGDSPSWQLQEINVGNLDEAALDEARGLPNPDELPSAYMIVEASDDVVAISEFGEVTRDTMTADQMEGLTDEEIEELIADEQTKNEQTTLSELAAVSPSVIAEAEDDGSVDFGGWVLLSTADAGEAQASATAFLVESDAFDFESQGEFKVLDSYTIGGKPARDGDGWFDRLTHQLSSAARITHPTRYGVVQVQQVTEDSLVLIPGEPPPRAEADPDEPVISVIMIRDLGNLRLKPALVTLGSFAIFAALCLMLHERDKELMARRAAFEAGS